MKYKSHSFLLWLTLVYTNHKYRVSYIFHMYDTKYHLTFGAFWWFMFFVSTHCYRLSKVVFLQQIQWTNALWLLFITTDIRRGLWL
jgi:hypothetical protein